MPEALYFTDSDEANELIASDPLALLIGFAIDQQMTVQQAFQGPLRLKQRIGTLDAPRSRRWTRRSSRDAFRERAGDPPLPAARWRGACRSSARSSRRSTAVDAERVWTEAADAADLRRRIGALPGFGKMKITGLGSVLALRFGVEVASELVPEYPVSAASTRREALAEYQAQKRAHRETQRKLTQNNPA